MHPATLRAQLERYYAQKTDPRVQISDFAAISDGWETEVYSFTLTLLHQADARILRMYPGADSVETSTREYGAMLKLRRAGGYPVPSVMRHETDPAWMGKPFVIMQKIEGRPLGEVMREDVARQPELLTRFVQLFVDLHRIKLSKLDAGSESDPAGWLPALLARWRTGIVAERGQAWAAPVLGWLDANQVEAAATLSPLHGDFNWSNVLLTPDDSLYVIDWSGFQVGDYRYDLAWTLLLTQPMEARDFTLKEYARLSGHLVENLEYFDVLAALRRLFDLSVSHSSGSEAMGMRPETVTVMRQLGWHYRQVYDLLRERSGLMLPEIERLLESLKE